MRLFTALFILTMIISSCSRQGALLQKLNQDFLNSENFDTTCKFFDVDGGDLFLSMYHRTSVVDIPLKSVVLRWSYDSSAFFITIDEYMRGEPGLIAINSPAGFQTLHTITYKFTDREPAWDALITLRKLQALEVLKE